MEWFKSLFYDTNIDFVGKRRLAGTISTLLVIASWVLVFTMGPNWGIDFTGGTEIHIQFKEDVQIGEVRTGLHALGLSDDAVQQVGGDDDHEFIVRIQDASFGAAEFQQEVKGLLDQAYGPQWATAMHFDAEVGARLSIEYTGPKVEAKDVREVVKSIEGIQVKEGLDDNQVILKLPGLSRQVEAQLHSVMQGKDFTVIATDAVGPKVGGELRRQGVVAVAATLGLVLLYVAFRFDIGFAPGAIIALFHDVSLTLGIFVLFQRELNLPIVGALLTIVGYSLNDTIVIYDRIRENMARYRRSDLPGLLNVSINETISRTIATSVTTMMAMVAFLVLGGPVIENFALAMMIGIVVGTYSTVFVASPMILVMQDVKPWLAKIVIGAGPVDSEPAAHPVAGPVEEAPRSAAGTALAEAEASAAEGAADPDEGLSESEKRRRERARLAKERA
ncbi:MAG: protein translocase subunit SecF [Deltaproteobacteria bacterium]|nr:protein translocase subunit SecF [Deltaproteobacteria bacterium]